MTDIGFRTPAVLIGHDYLWRGHSPEDKALAEATMDLEDRRDDDYW